MKHNIIKTGILFITILTLIMAVLTIWILKDNREMNYRERIVDLNEIQELTTLAIKKGDSNTKEKLDKRIQLLQNELRNESVQRNSHKILIYIAIVYSVCLIFIFIIFIYIYYVVIRPFKRLEKYANEVASGNLDLPLQYERQNLFGAFTWAFDHMRKEVKKARACEKEAIENNKTVIATISHDIKTPIASIRAYSEGLLANMDTSAERRERYLSVIMNKCDEVSKLSNDLFLHSLSNLDKLVMNLEVCDAKKVITPILEQIIGENDNIVILNEVMDVKVRLDIRRFEQVLENVIGNSKKYASESRIEISFNLNNHQLECHIRDYGKGISEEDIPFLFEKFYRGKNIENKPGAGLGLYIVKYIMEQMDGSVDLNNYNSNGVEITLEIPMYESSLS
ncbi:HAMP domain-containing sensor histidine kinase [Anaeromicropila herbilytica]|uniref:histidine kinase n=1 Tax=Anaeromicropila herbilytica TaxID=2785025 RepID=A0A7R7ICJ8_9FIRM|nr:HAMP domain-containing sensor histidine kinase [Anaeromicropila herbilytica]BCN29946.1 hypothetical protein bsdtb5_12410 [Anaeromicropila herbilytica]